MKDRTFKFSIIIPVYNVEDYLEETILSVINQSIGFEKNVEIILVNDGSTDNSKDICEKYQKKYPDNVRYIAQENAGVSAARNKGLAYAQGEYINFLDSDDKWSKNTFRDVYKFFEKHKDKIDVVACRMKYFEAKTGYHVLDYKFEKTKVVDITEDYTFVHMHAASSFFKRKALEGKSFDVTMKYAEDAKLANEVILEKKAYGVLREAVYEYRARKNESSAMNQMHFREIWYTYTLEQFHLYMLQLCKEKYGEVIPYVQYLLMYDLKWRINANLPEGIFDKAFAQKYIDTIQKILQDISDGIIVEQKQFSSDVKYAVLNLKYKEDVLSKIRFENSRFYIGEYELTNYNRVRVTKVHFLDVTKDTIELMGQCNYWMPPNAYKVYVINEKEEREEKTKYYFEFFPVHGKPRTGLLGTYGENRGFKVTIPYEKTAKISVFIEYIDGSSCQVAFGYGKFAKLNQLKSAYGVIDGKFLVRRRKRSFQVMPRSKKKYKEFEQAYCKELKELGHGELLKYRFLKRLLKRFKKNEIWLVSDRMSIARDNGEAFFTYLCEKKPEGIKPYFVLSKDSIDYKRMKKIGKVIPMNSFRYKCLFLVADKIISAHADEYIINAFGKDREYLKNIYDFKYVFLQHGITKDDISDWLNKYNKNIHMFVTAAKKEYQSILDGNYFYDASVVKHTGFPRHDKLKQSKEHKKQIIFLPTWRAGLVGDLDLKTGKRAYNEEYKNSEFCKFYNRLINDERILKVMERKGYRGKFCLHTNNMAQIVDFHGNDMIQVNEEALDYTKEFLDNALMISDYSSVAFDFAYTKKPLIYIQFDRKEFYEGQAYSEGYFSYENDGFGPVCMDYEEAVAQIVSALESDCVMEENYQKRVDEFFGTFEKSNCENVFQEILALETTKKLQDK